MLIRATLSRSFSMKTNVLVLDPRFTLFMSWGSSSNTDLEPRKAIYSSRKALRPTISYQNYVKRKNFHWVLLSTLHIKTVYNQTKITVVMSLAIFPSFWKDVGCQETHSSAQVKGGAGNMYSPYSSLPVPGLYRGSALHASPYVPRVSFLGGNARIHFHCTELCLLKRLGASAHRIAQDIIESSCKVVLCRRISEGRNSRIARTWFR
ncbi:hypothetical protein BU16DRAFT_286141 [Lophium mytilinum]|uniref:Uncharacterized protein n=1 Tax=Lophium mytilinum TaxID=390894 RepID=A0A6A6R310_9PEZI|nr:hypothetical protein BU16DRAFT_286141 [Lophium mytilinum]